MIAMPELLVRPAQAAGIKVPEDYLVYDKREFPHWNLFLNAQLGMPMPHASCHWDNAKVIASFSAEEVHNIRNMDTLKQRGFAIGYSV